MPDKTRVALPPSLRKYLRELGRRGGQARAKKLDKQTRRAQAQHAASFRWTGGPVAKKR